MVNNSQVNISVIIPVYNGESYLDEAIKSILSQSFQPSEIIVVDDGSTDKSKTIVKKYSQRINYFYQNNAGTASSRNFGITKSNGNFLAFLDQDDVWESHKLEIQANAFQKNNNLDIVFTHLQQFYSPELTDEIKMKIHCPDHPEPGYLPSSMLIKRDSFFKVGLFGIKWKVGEWSNWYIRATEAKLSIKLLQDVLVKRRIHNENKGILQREFRTEYAQILKESLDRRRKKNEV